MSILIEHAVMLVILFLNWNVIVSSWICKCSQYLWRHFHFLIQNVFNSNECQKQTETNKQTNKHSNKQTDIQTYKQTKKRKTRKNIQYNVFKFNIYFCHPYKQVNLISDFLFHITVFHRKKWKQILLSDGNLNGALTF